VRGNGDNDFVVMDDFLYATPTAAPEPASLSLLGFGFLAFGLARKRLRR
jgi:hypothetical protein